MKTNNKTNKTNKNNKTLQYNKKFKNKNVNNNLTIQVHFKTSIQDKSLHLDENIIYNIPSNLNSNQLSKVINHLLKESNNNNNNNNLYNFDFLIKNKLLIKSILQHIKANKIDSESIIDIEYIEKTVNPNIKESNQHPDWVSCVDLLGVGTSHVLRSKTLKNDNNKSISSYYFITGCYDGVIRIWNIGSTLNDKYNITSKCLTQCRSDISPIKGICGLYSTSLFDYFATGSKNRNIKIFRFNKSNNKIKELYVVSNKNILSSIECLSSPSPSKLFATGSSDNNIRIYRIPNQIEDKNTKLNENIDFDTSMLEPPFKRRKLNTKQDNIETKKLFNNSNKSNKNNIISETMTLHGHKNVITCLDWTNPGALYSGSMDGIIKLWDIERELDIYSWNTSSSINYISYWNNCNIIISCHSNQKICLWDPRTNINVSTKSSKYVYRSHRLPITSISCNEFNSKPLFITSSHDGKIKFWDLRSNEPLYNMEKHNGKILCTKWYKNVIVSGGTDKKLICYHWKI